MNRFINKHLNLVLVICGLINIILVLIFEFPCPWKSNFNIDCAGCGATRMFKSLLNLEIYQAFRFNPFLFCLLIFALFYLIYIFICKVRKKAYYKIKDRDLLILLILVILFTILRNIPGLEFLKPTVV
ncbi:MAG: DUF2752 domain-containing protein [Bacilli bacterium]|nr:DUF2752 domain-containing protein [Bacilli bacterium]